MPDKYPSQTAEKIVIRLPDGMRDRLAAVAKENKRSVNAEVVARLEESFHERTGSAKAPSFKHLEETFETLKMLIENRKTIEEAFEKDGRPLLWSNDSEPNEDPEETN